MSIHGDLSMARKEMSEHGEEPPAPPESGIGRKRKDKVYSQNPAAVKRREQRQRKKLQDKRVQEQQNMQQEVTIDHLEKSVALQALKALAEVGTEEQKNSARRSLVKLCSKYYLDEG
eukprot:m.24051 g.24051  ORF g.24051 m.24051 type:complete len:117 (+) comp7571_c0_seq1:221-571(+)